MTFRPGTPGARRLFESKDPALFEENFARYKEAVKLVAKAAKKSELPALDEWLHEKFAKEEPPHLDLKILQKIVEWKLCRGKDRPMLRGLVKQNTNKAVQEAFASSMKSLDEDDWQNAIKELANLRGVGPATASAILAPLKKGGKLCPFMADEVLEAVTGKKREYTLKAYESMQKILASKTRELNKISNSRHDWSANEVGTAIWTAGVLSIQKGGNWDESPSVSSNKVKAESVNTVDSDINKKTRKRKRA